MPEGIITLFICLFAFIIASVKIYGDLWEVLCHAQIWNMSHKTQAFNMSFTR